MKVGSGGGGIDPSLIERIQAAHAEEVGEASSASAAESTGATSAASSAAASAAPEPPTGLKLGALEVARAVVKGDIQESSVARERIIDAIVDDRFGDALDRPEARQAKKMLKSMLADDPNFTREVDEMLVLAARELHVLGR